MSENPDYNCASGREIAEIKTVLAAVVDSMTRNETEILNIEVFPVTVCMDLVGEKQSRTYGQSWAAWFKTTTNEILNQLRANNLSELGKKLSQPHLDESFEIKSDGDVSSEDEEETADDLADDAKWDALAEVASAKGNLKQLQALIEARPERVNQQVYVGGWTVLLNAASAGHSDMCAWLLRQQGIDVNKANTEGTTPLLVAAAHGHNCVVIELLAAKADMSLHDRDNASPFVAAALHGHPEVMQLLVDSGLKLSRSVIRKALKQSLHTDQAGSVEFLLKRALRWPSKTFKNLLSEYRNQCKKSTEELFELAKTECWVLRGCHRAWCRVLWSSEFHDSAPLPESTGPTGVLLQWFRDFPGLRRLVGGVMVSYFSQVSAEWLCPRPPEDEASSSEEDAVPLKSAGTSETPDTPYRDADEIFELSSVSSITSSDSLGAPE